MEDIHNQAIVLHFFGIFGYVNLLMSTLIKYLLG